MAHAFRARVIGTPGRGSFIGRRPIQNPFGSAEHRQLPLAIASRQVGTFARIAFAGAHAAHTDAYDSDDLARLPYNLLLTPPRHNSLGQPCHKPSAHLRTPVP